MEKIRNIVLVASGKGGVGKSTVSANLAVALSQLGHRVGLLDADIYGPSVPTMFGGAEEKPGSDGKKMQPLLRHGIKVMSMGYLVEPNTAVVWRGPMLAGAVLQFVNDVDWGELDYLIFDLPPGTGDIQLSLAQKLQVTGALLVTTPQDVALADVRRAKAMFDRVRIPSVGLVENMSYFVCSECDARHEIFAHGGGAKAAKELGVPVLGEIPIDTDVRAGGDEGTPLSAGQPDSPTANAFSALARKLDAALGARQREAEAAPAGLEIIQ